MQDAPLHRLSVGSLVQFVDEVPRGYIGLPSRVLTTLDVPMLLGMKV